MEPQAKKQKLSHDFESSNLNLFSVLPEEMHLEILKYLNQKDILNVSLVNKQLSEMIARTKYFKNYPLILRKSTALEEFVEGRKILKAQRKYSSVFIKNFQKEYLISQVTKSLSSSLTLLHVKSIGVVKKVNISMLNNCDNLKVLQLHNVDIFHDRIDKDLNEFQFQLKRFDMQFDFSLANPKINENRLKKFLQSQCCSQLIEIFLTSCNTDILKTVLNEMPHLKVLGIKTLIPKLTRNSITLKIKPNINITQLKTPFLEHLMIHLLPNLQVIKLEEITREEVFNLSINCPLKKVEARFFKNYCRFCMEFEYNDVEVLQEEYLDIQFDSREYLDDGIFYENCVNIGKQTFSKDCFL